MKQSHAMTISAPNVLRVEDIAPKEGTNPLDKTEMWAKESLVISKNHVEHVTVIPTLPDQDLCIDRGIRTI